MKLALAVVLLLAGVAHAQSAPPMQPVPPMQPAPPMQHAPPMQPAPRGQLRQLLLQRFDRNHDGRLDVRERRQAARALHRLANRMVQPDARARRQRKFIRRFDLDHDGNVGPNEMPPGLADQMRPLDRDGDGWLRDDELP